MTYERRRRQARWQFVPLLVLAVLSWGGAEPGVRIGYVALVVVALAVSIRASRSYSVEFRNDEVVIHGTYRTRRIPWERVADVGVSRSRWPALYPEYPHFELDDGSMVRAGELRLDAAREVVEEAQRRLDEAGNNEGPSG